MLRSVVWRLGCVGALVLLQACAQTPEVPAVVPVTEEAPEITLNLPEQPECNCEVEPAPADYTFLERGYASLAAAEYESAAESFRRYHRLESSPQADWEADIAITYLMTLPDSPLYDPKEARKHFRDLNEANWQAMQLHQQTLLLRQSLDSFLVMSRRLRELRDSNDALQQDLEKREEAIKRLRELTLGQTGSAQ